jgi:hypothetical protein
MSLQSILVLELFFILYYIPKTMTRLAKDHGRNALAWSLTGIGAWLGAQVIVVLTFIALYTLGVFLWGWPLDFPPALELFVWVSALAAAGGSLIVVERRLSPKPRVKSYPPPPPAF